ncbi:MAG: dihydropyrimidinase [Candidatus Rifleibacteriota bacterium]
MYDLVLKNGLVFIDNDFHKMDVAISGEKIACLGNNLKGNENIDVSGGWILPGAIDAHTHFSLPFAGAVSADNFYSGTRAGAIGGVTTIIDFLAQEGSEGVLASLKKRKEQAEGQAAIDYGFHACIGKYSSEVANQMDQLCDYGLTSFKVFMAYGKTGKMQSDFNLLKIMQSCVKNGLMLTVHSENGNLIDDLTDEAEKNNNLGIKSLISTRPVISEVEAINRLGLLAAETGCKTYVVHTSSGSGAEKIAELRALGAPIIGETCPQYLYLDNSKLKTLEGHYFSCCPPVRSKKQQEKLWSNLDRDHIAVVATDHCPFTLKDKNSWNESILSLPMGLPGIETLPAFVLNGAAEGKICVEKAVKSISENPAKLFGLYPEKGSLLPGTDADIMVFSPQKKWQVKHSSLNMNLDYSPYEGLEITGKNIMTLFRGNVIYGENLGWKGQKGQGKFLERKKTDQTFF